MVTVTNNSPQQINAALLSINKNTNYNIKSEIDKSAQYLQDYTNKSAQSLQDYTDKSAQSLKDYIDQMITAQSEISAGITQTLANFGQGYFQTIDKTMNITKFFEQGNYGYGYGSSEINISHNSSGAFVILTIPGPNFWGTDFAEECTYIATNKYVNNMTYISPSTSIFWAQPQYHTVNNSATNTVLLKKSNVLSDSFDGAYGIFGEETNLSDTIAFAVPPNINKFYISSTMFVKDTSNAGIPSSVQVQGIILQRMTDIVQ